jgi:two-component system chemotaxis response regulator CheB
VPLEAVVIGASAGAIEALRELLPTLSRQLWQPIIVVVHLPPRRQSLLPELFSPLCAVPVTEPLDKQPISGSGIWFAPADYHLLIDARRFAFSLEPPVHYSRPSVDVLFESAACAYGASLTGVVLSGASDDGAAGARSIRQHGGHVYVQDPGQALVRTMPDAAIRLAAPQFVGSLAAIATLLCDFTGWSP